MKILTNAEIDALHSRVPEFQKKGVTPCGLALYRFTLGIRMEPDDTTIQGQPPESTATV